MAKVTTVGDRVKLKKDNLVGVCRFIGEIQGKKGVFYGIELDEAKGKNDGSVKKIPYFKCGKKKGLFVAATAIAKTNTKNNKDAPRVTVGDTVTVTKAKCKGKIRFIGTPYSVKDSGVFYGIELQRPKGKNNGTVKGRWYFTCKDKYGTFVQAAGMTVSGAPAAADKEKKTGAKGKKKKETTSKKTKKDEAAKKTEVEKKEDVEYVKGDRVMVKPSKKGQIKYIGNDYGEVLYGIRLTEARGDCDGEWKDKRFFQCPENFGVYVPLRLIMKKLEDEDFDFMNEEEKYEEEARAKAEVYKKEAEKLKALREKFNEVDTNKSQTIDRDEFNKLAIEVFSCSTAEANELFKEIDVNGSGEISFAEFDAWVDKLGGIENLNKEAVADEEQNDDDAKTEEAEKAEDAEKGDDDSENADKGDDAEKVEDVEKQDGDDEDADKGDDAEKVEDNADDADANEQEEKEADDNANDEETTDDKEKEEEQPDAEQNNDDAGYEAPADDAPADDAPADDAPAEDAPAEDAPAEEVAADDAAGDDDNAGADEQAADNDEDDGDKADAQ